MTFENASIMLENYESSEILDEILRNLRVLYGTVVGTHSGDRDFGLDTSFVDMPPPTAKALFSAEVIRKTRIYEPRAEVRGVEWEEDAKAGILTPKVVISINE